MPHHHSHRQQPHLKLFPLTRRYTNTPASPNPVSQAQEPGAPQPAFSSSTEAVASKAADSIRVPEMPAEPAPSALKPGQSITAVLKTLARRPTKIKRKGWELLYRATEPWRESYLLGQDLRELIENHKTGDVVTLTLNSRDSWHVPERKMDA